MGLLYTLEYLGSTVSLDNKKLYFIGRSMANDVVLLDTTVSRKHAVIEWDEDSFRVRDTGSANGVYVNDEKISAKKLETRDRIKVGKFELFYTVLDEAELNALNLDTLKLDTKELAQEVGQINPKK